MRIGGLIGLFVGIVAIAAFTKGTQNNKISIGINVEQTISSPSSVPNTSNKGYSPFPIVQPISYELAIKESRVNQPTQQKTNPNKTTQQTIASHIRIKADHVLVRKGPSPDHPQVTKVFKGKTAKVLGKSGQWVKVKFAGGTVGYVRGDFVAATAPPKVQNTNQNTKFRTYKVVQGDNDWKIAKKFGVTRPELHAANPGTDWTKLQIGRTLQVPVKAKPNSYYASSSHATYVKIKKDAVNIRKGPSTGHSTITAVNKGIKARVLGVKGDWAQLKFPQGTVGYVRRDFLVAYNGGAASNSGANPRANRNVQTSRPSKKTPSNQYLASAGNAGDLIAEARKHLGTRYKWGGNTTRGFDCSGFVKYVYNQSKGVSLPRTSKEQAKVGQTVARSQLKPGDIVSFRTRSGSRINHSGIYIGNGKFIHSSSGKGQVRIDSLDSGFYKQRFAFGRRVSGGSATPKKETESQKPKPKAEAPKSEQTVPKPEPEKPAENNNQTPPPAEGKTTGGDTKPPTNGGN